jgi:hypothetical protein
MPTTFDWNSISDPGGVANNRPRGSNCSGDLSNHNYDVQKGLIYLAGDANTVGGILSVGDVFKFTNTTNGTFTSGSSYTVQSVNIYQFLPCTISTTFANAPDSITFTSGATIAVDYLWGNFVRTSAASAVSPYGVQIPAHI